MEMDFKNLKEALSTEPILDFLDLENPFVVETDDSLRAAWAVLVNKKEEGRKNPYSIRAAQLMIQKKDTKLVREKI